MPEARCDRRPEKRTHVMGKNNVRVRPAYGKNAILFENH